MLFPRMNSSFQETTEGADVNWKCPTHYWSISQSCFEKSAFCFPKIMRWINPALQQNQINNKQHSDDDSVRKVTMTLAGWSCWVLAHRKQKNTCRGLESTVSTSFFLILLFSFCSPFSQLTQLISWQRISGTGHAIETIFLSLQLVCSLLSFITHGEG